MPDIKLATDWMIETARDNTHGYDQAHRNGPDYDCSSFVSTALNKAGFNVKPTSTTRNLYDQLIACGFKSCNKPWKEGDIHLKIGKHVVMSIDANNIVSATENEKGTATGGKTGDQTGTEICISKYYEYSGGWDCHLRYEETPSLTADVLDKTIKHVMNGKLGSGANRRKTLSALSLSPLAIQLIVNYKLGDTYTLYRDICSIIALCVDSKIIDTEKVAEEYSLPPDELKKRIEKIIEVLPWEQI